MNFFDKCKHLTVIVGEGSGVIYQPKAEYSYILTAKHNLKDEENVKITKYDGYQLTIQKIYKHKTLDIAIIKIDRIESPKNLLQVNAPKYLEKYKFYGYPVTRRDETKIDEKIFDYDLEITSTSKENYHINVRNIDSSPYDEIVGFSGGGIFNSENTDEKAEIYLAGIECQMDIKGKEDEEETHNRLKVISIKAFDEIVDEYSNELVYLYSIRNYNKIYKVEKDKIVVGSKSFIIKTVNLKSDKYNLNVAIYPVTYSQYDLFCKDKRNGKKINSYLNIDRKQFPVVKVTLKDAIEFSHWLTDNSENKWIYTLPSSEEWEFIANENKSHNNICYRKGINTKIGTNLGEKGIYDFLGNIQEICRNEVVRGGFFRNDLNKIIKNREGITLLPRKEVGFRVIQANL